MTPSEILAAIGHRPWCLPNTAWQYYQEWSDVAFLHWKVSYDELRTLVPRGLEIDLFEGAPWVSLVAFSMQKVKTRHLPAFAPISNFHEINIRTYIRSGDKTGVYFLSIEGGKRISCAVAKNLSGLPYRFSEIRRSKEHYYASNKIFNDRLRLEYTVKDAVVDKTDLDRWLTERYALFKDCDRGICEYEIHHVEWPIDEIEITHVDIAYPRFSKLINDSPDKIHYSRGVQVIAWGRNMIDF